MLEGSKASELSGQNSWRLGSQEAGRLIRTQIDSSKRIASAMLLTIVSNEQFLGLRLVRLNKLASWHAALSS
jgi:hypothetical protein